MQNIIVSLFDVESESFQAMTGLKQDPGSADNFISQAALVKKKNGTLSLLDSFDTGANSSDNVAMSGLIGMAIGILGGPIGILLGGSIGALTGMGIDAMDSKDEASFIQCVAAKLDDDDVAIIALASENNEDYFDGRLSAYKTTIVRYDAAVVAAEVDEAEEFQREMDRQAKEAIRKHKNDEFKAKVEKKRDELADQFKDTKEDIFN
ncbi:MAG: DUF1269 domain-containing protein [Lachnospiraceae bacterium]|nr:DUF1269 domain-containing protein [Lachnospiraceae bacterium]